MRTLLLPVLAAALLAGCAATPAPKPDLAALKQQVIDTETAFAATMAARDHAAFVSFLAEETVWFAGKSGVLRGKDAVAQDWKRFYDGPDAPFSWQPTEVEVLDSGTLAISSGPVFGPDGKQFAVYHSIWRLEAPGQWRIIFDKGGCACGPGK